MSNPLRTLFEYRGIGIQVETHLPSNSPSILEVSIFAFGRLLETRRVAADRFPARAPDESPQARVHRTVLSAVRAGRFDDQLHALARRVFLAPGPGREQRRVAEAEAPAAVRPPAVEPLAVELLGELPAPPGTRLELAIRAFGRDSGSAVADARVHAQLIAEGEKVRASLSGATDANGRLGLRVQLPSTGASSLALRVEHGGETILLRQELCPG